MITTSNQPASQTHTPSQQLVILDAGAQYAKVIDRRVRELAVESIILPLNTPAEDLKKYRAIIISGGPESVYADTAPKYDPALFELKMPIFGICYGMQLMNYVFGGTVERKDIREDGPRSISIKTDSLLFQNLEENQEVLMTHGDTVDQVAEGFRTIALSGELIAGIENKEKQYYGVQFHPEVDITVHGMDMLRNFLFTIAGFAGDFSVADREEQALSYIRTTIGDGYALVLVSGGVDSTVSAALATKALGKDKVFAVHIDSGFMRAGESQLVKEALMAHGLDITVVDAAETFLHGRTTIKSAKSADKTFETQELTHVTDPEHKRKIIGDTFMRVANQALEDLKLPKNNTYLVQGTLRPDLIESASSTVSSNATVIKTHHNDTALVRELREAGRVVEPLSEYHKDEVRELGKLLGLPDELIWRQPFPGPGLAIRVLCANEPYVTDDFDSINARLAEFVTESYAATLLPVRTVGVQGDVRTYSYIVGLTGPQNWEELSTIALKIPASFKNVNRIVYMFDGLNNSGQTETSKPQIITEFKEITPTTLTPESVAQVRHADQIVNEVLAENNLFRSISQVPVVSFPVHFGTPGNRSIGIRTLITNDFMTGVPALPGREMPLEALKRMVERILQEVPGISRVVYDLTPKPPGTTEWE